MRYLAIVLGVFLIITGAQFAYAEDDPGKVDDRVIDLKERRLQFEREKWEWERQEEQRKEFEAQFPNMFDFKRDIPTYELTGYVGDADRQNLQKIFTILLEKGIKTARINISSFGGSAFDGMGVADTIVSFKNKGMTIHGYAFGKIASAAIPIFASCSTRTAGSSTMFMVHEASIFKFFQSDSTSDISAQKEMMDKLESRYINMLVLNSKMSAGHWMQAIRKETWFIASTALEWGLVDKIE
jgi:ATP-dependent protease ClpP protease subunit